jgi:hypothetical protein
MQNSAAPHIIDPRQWLNDPLVADKDGCSISHALKLLGLGLSVVEIKVKIRYQQMAREYHPDKYNKEVMGLTMAEVSDIFKLLNNANMSSNGNYD